MSLPLLKLDQVEAGYGSTLCLHGISLEVKEGEVVTLLGANGAGKTTTLMVISGMVPVHKGMVLFRQAPLNGVLPSQVVEQGISHVPEGRRILPQLTVQENLILGTFQRKDKAQIEADQKRLLEWFPVLAQRKRQLAGTLSGGEQQMLAIARGLMGRPKLLLLDEPSLGLAPKLVAVLFEIIRRIN
ncbi:MAG: ABC transporter ATP-binding protein, partial [Candidatus Omnitrophica bacterium]|nr:ABC transporter ATP-binding protein [Candidatus Omnitrophota bacterium]